MAAIIKGRFFWLLLGILVVLLASSVAPQTEAGLGESAVAFAALLVAATYAARGGKKLLGATLILNAVFIAAMGHYFLVPGTPSVAICLVVLMACLALSLGSTMRFVLQTGTVTAEHILGAICAYALIAMVFATLYTLQWLVNPEAFKGLTEVSRHPWIELFYFSCTTLSTVGYGDIVPALRSTRSVAIVEQMTGVFYIAILVARLSSLYPPPKTEDPS